MQAATGQHECDEAGGTIRRNFRTMGDPRGTILSTKDARASSVAGTGTRIRFVEHGMAFTTDTIYLLSVKGSDSQSSRRLNSAPQSGL